MRINVTHESERISMRSTYHVPYRLNRTGSLTRPLGLAEQGYVMVEATDVLEAITQAKKIIGRPHVIYVDGIVEA